MPSNPQTHIRTGTDAPLIALALSRFIERAMTKYHFNVVDRHGTIPDEEGTNFRFFSQALTEAKESARDLAKYLLTNKTVLIEQCVEITDEGGQTLAALPVVEVLRHPNFPRFQEKC
jgi:hypothetical protein